MVYVVVFVVLQMCFPCLSRGDVVSHRARVTKEAAKSLLYRSAIADRKAVTTSESPAAASKTVITGFIVLC